LAIVNLRYADTWSLLILRDTGDRAEDTTPTTVCSRQDLTAVTAALGTMMTAISVRADNVLTAAEYQGVGGTVLAGGRGRFRTCDLCRVKSPSRFPICISRS